LAARGIEVAAGLLREEARAVLQDYHRNGGMIYNTGCLGGST
jgi:hypothetical protein